MFFIHTLHESRFWEVVLESMFWIIYSIFIMSSRVSLAKNNTLKNTSAHKQVETIWTAKVRKNKK